MDIIANNREHIATTLRSQRLRARRKRNLYSIS